MTFGILRSRIWMRATSATHLLELLEFLALLQISAAHILESFISRLVGCFPFLLVICFLVGYFPMELGCAEGLVDAIYGWAGVFLFVVHVSVIGFYELPFSAGQSEVGDHAFCFVLLVLLLDIV